MRLRILRKISNKIHKLLSLIELRGLGLLRAFWESAFDALLV